jgi:hypothetical protein
LEKILEESVETGVVRPGLEHEDAAGAILSTIMFNAAYAPTISGTPEPRDGERASEQMWQFVSAGILAGSGA